MNLRAIIIDDEQRGIDSLTVLVEHYTTDVKVVGSTTKAQEAIGLIENYRPEIIFLDIQMPDMNGFELLEKLSHRNFNLVFTTAHQEYGLRALKSNAVDYLLKPIDCEDLIFAIHKIKARFLTDSPATFDRQELLQHLYSTGSRKLLVYSKTGIEPLEMEEIILLESRSNYTNIYLDNKPSILISKTLKEFDAQLCIEESGFVRVHYSFIINLEKVTRFIKGENTIVMTNAQKIPLAKSRRSEFLKWLDLLSKKRPLNI